MNNLLALEPREAGTDVLEPTIGFLETVSAQEGRLQIDSTWDQAPDSTWAQAPDSTWAQAADSTWAQAADSTWA